jgi:hypothetical protein
MGKFANDVGAEKALSEAGEKGETVVQHEGGIQTGALRCGRRRPV